MTREPQTLSEWLMFQAENCPRLPDAASGLEAHEFDQKLATLTRAMLSQRESLNDPGPESAADLKEWQDQIPRAFEKLLDDHYTRVVLGDIPGMVSRTKSLFSGGSAENLPLGIRRLLGEATRAYVRGLWHATVVLSRATCEQALKYRLSESKDRLCESSADLVTYIQRAVATGALDKRQVGQLHWLRHRANEILHAGPTDSQQAPELALNAIQCARGTVLSLFPE